eukprot:gene15961-24421_t
MNRRVEDQAQKKFQQLLARYTPGKLLGTGGFSKVWEGKGANGESVAIKMLHLNDAGGSSADGENPRGRRPKGMDERKEVPDPADGAPQNAAKRRKTLDSRRETVFFGCSALLATIIGVLGAQPPPENHRWHAEYLKLSEDAQPYNRQSARERMVAKANTFGWQLPGQTDGGDNDPAALFEAVWELATDMLTWNPQHRVSATVALDNLPDGYVVPLDTVLTTRVRAIKSKRPISSPFLSKAMSPFVSSPPQTPPTCNFSFGRLDDLLRDLSSIENEHDDAADTAAPLPVQDFWTAASQRKQEPKAQQPAKDDGMSGLLAPLGRLSLLPAAEAPATKRNAPLLCLPTSQPFLKPFSKPVVPEESQNLPVSAGGRWGAE